MLRKTLTTVLLLAGATFLPAAADAAPAFTVGTAVMRAGPDFDYPIVRAIRPNRGVFINGCLGDWSWCDVSFHDDRGWIPGNQLAADYRGRRQGFIGIAPFLGIGSLTFSFGNYWDKYYRGRPFYSERNHWQDHYNSHYRPAWGPRPSHPYYRDNHRDDHRGNDKHGHDNGNHRGNDKHDRDHDNRGR